jgi:hypothetical protein
MLIRRSLASARSPVVLEAPAIRRKEKTISALAVKNISALTARSMAATSMPGTDSSLVSNCLAR